MEIKKTVAGPLSTNCYIVSFEQEGIIIDPSGKFDELKAYIEDHQINIEAILLTHGHYDHILVLDQVANFTDAPIYLGIRDKELLGDPNLNLSGPLNIVRQPADYYIEKEETLNLLPSPIEVLETPGHSPGHVSYYFPKENCIFSGDVLFKQAVGRTDLILGDPEALIHTLQEKILPLPEETVIYPGHGANTDLSSEKLENPYLQNIKPQG